MIRKIQLVPTASGQMTINVIFENGRNVFLHSLVDPIQEAAAWADGVDVKQNTLYVVLGFGLGYHIKCLEKKLPANSLIYVIETAFKEQMYQKLLVTMKNLDWLKDSKKITLLGNESVHSVASSINKSMQETNVNQLTLCCYYPAMAINERDYQQYIQELARETEKLRNADLSFSLMAGKKLFENAWSNLPSIFEQYSALELKDCFKGKAALLVASGPSLNKNIELIKKIREKVIVIAAGTAISALYHHNITPDFLVIIDPFDINGEVLVNYLKNETILVAPYEAPPLLVNHHKGKICYYKKPLRFSDEHVLSSIDDYLPQTEFLMSHISVAVTAFSFAEMIGAEPIIFVGQDLSFSQKAFEGDKDAELAATHAAGVQAGKYASPYLRKRRCKVEGYYGGNVETTQEFKLIIDFLAAVFEKRMMSRTIINATEGGARIPNTVQMSLSEVEKRYLVDDIHVISVLENLFRNNSFNNESINAFLQILETVQEESMNIFQDCKTIESKYTKSGSYDLKQAESFNKAIDEFLRRIKETRMYPFIKPYYAVVIDLYELEQQADTDSLAKAKRSNLIMSSLQWALTLLIEKLEQSTKGLKGKYGKEQ